MSEKVSEKFLKSAKVQMTIGNHAASTSFDFWSLCVNSAKDNIPSSLRM